MKLSIWHHVEVKQPEQTGHYLGVKQTWIGDDYPGIDMYFYEKKNKIWMTNNKMFSARVIYWTDANPYNWLEETPSTSTPALDNALHKVQTSVEQYEIIKSLVSGTMHD